MSMNAAKNRILILGAAGFIGTNLTLRLLEEKERLLLFDRPDAVYPAKVQKAIRDGKAGRIDGSFSEPNAEGWLTLIPQLFEVDTVYHLISTTCPTNSNQDVAVEMEENLIATVRFLDACVKAGVKKVVFLSSGGTVYGKEHTGICREEEEAFPITSYGVQKLAIEKMLYLYHEMYGLDYRIVRLSNPYGPYQRPNGVQGVVTTFTWKALNGQPIEIYGDGSVVRDYIYISDAIDGILKIARGEKKNRLYNLGRGEGRSVADVVEAITKVLGKRPEVIYRPTRPVDVPVNVLDISRFKEDFGTFEPVSLQTGIRRLLDFFTEQEA
ncbi:MAG: NAD-dependent epimerase/dehydratase family protein [Lachnospiraceae bacterium]|nr:NAD-dependent epimerase/dehydratase family protein [Lachnospiraceae bacterium]